MMLAIPAMYDDRQWDQTGWIWARAAMFLYYRMRRENEQELG